MPKKEVVKNDDFTFKFTTSNKTNNFNKNYSKNVIEQINSDQIAKNNKNIVKKSENLIKNSPTISLESKNLSEKITVDKKYVKIDHVSLNDFNPNSKNKLTKDESLLK